MSSMTTESGVFQGFASSVVVHKDHTGYILGRKCTTMNGVQRKTHTRVRWNDVPLRHSGPNKSVPMVRFVICGRSEKDVLECYHEILRLGGIADVTTPRAHLMPMKNVPNVVSVRGMEERCFVPAASVGMVLGKKGRKIDEITSQTSTWSKFFKEDVERGSPGCFSVRGFYEEDMRRAVDKIHAIVDSCAKAGRPRDLTIADMMNLQSAGDVFNGGVMSPPPGPPPSDDSRFGVMVSGSPTYSPDSPTYAPPDSPTYAPPDSPPSRTLSMATTLGTVDDVAPP